MANVHTPADIAQAKTDMERVSKTFEGYELKMANMLRGVVKTPEGTLHIEECSNRDIELVLKNVCSLPRQS